MAETDNIVNIIPCEKSVDLNNGKFIKLTLSPEQKSSISLAIQQAPNLIAAGTMAKAYIATFPDGIQHELVRLKRGGFMSTFRDAGGTKFSGTASLYPLGAQAAILGAFSAMSIATGQYFLTEITKKFEMVNLKLDSIINFLYGDKKAELMSEIAFVQYAYNNYTSLMQHDEQRIATIVSLQESRKIAMKDIEFYITDLESKAESLSKKFSDFHQITTDSFAIKESLEMSAQLYAISSLMETFYSQNFDSEYVSALKTVSRGYLSQCQTRIGIAFGTLRGQKSQFEQALLKKSGSEELFTKLDELNTTLKSGGEPKEYIALCSSLDKVIDCKAYYITSDGEAYIAA